MDPGDMKTEDNPCVYIGKYFTIDVREVAEEIKYACMFAANATIHILSIAMYVRSHQTSIKLQLKFSW